MEHLNGCRKMEWVGNLENFKGMLAYVSNLKPKISSFEQRSCQANIRIAPKRTAVQQAAHGNHCGGSRSILVK